MIRDLGELTPGQPVVHLDHGVGRYLGLETIDAGGLPTEFLTWNTPTATSCSCRSPVCTLISRWRQPAQPQARRRGLGQGAAQGRGKVRTSRPSCWMSHAMRQPVTVLPSNTTGGLPPVCRGFPFRGDPDQLNAINAVLGDMSRPSMDRLVCGDVGFGKTEVAMRAAFVAVHGGKQVAVLVPTTLLAQQHYDNFRDRFANWPVNIVEVLSRFKSAKEQSAVMKPMAEGQGGHHHRHPQAALRRAHLRIWGCSSSTRSTASGAPKGKIKALRADVDILTLTATPIPHPEHGHVRHARSLHHRHPTAKRLAIKTFVRQHDRRWCARRYCGVQARRPGLLPAQRRGEHREVCRRSEAGAGGAHVIAHGQMRGAGARAVMSDFYHQRFNLLVCTTIIEPASTCRAPTPSSWTGRITLAGPAAPAAGPGRRSPPGLCLPAHPHPKLMTKDAAKRLEAIASLEDLGAGFALATHDLEIRGAGELLGDDQSSQIESSATLYMEMLEQAVKSLRGARSRRWISS